MSSFTKLGSTESSGRRTDQSNIMAVGQDPRRQNPNSQHFPSSDSSTSYSQAPASSDNRGHIPRRDDPDHIPRPRNAFFVFRSSYVNSINNQGTTQDSQSQLSKNAAMVWSTMSSEEKAPFFEQALCEKDMHYETHPNYHYTPSRAGAKGIRRTGVSAQNNMSTMSPLHRDFIPTSQIPELSLSPKDEPCSPSLTQNDALSFYHHLDDVVYPCEPHRHQRYNHGDPTLPPLPRSSLPASSLLCDDPYPSAHYLSSASSVPYRPGPQRGNQPHFN